MSRRSHGRLGAVLVGMLAATPALAAGQDAAQAARDHLRAERRALKLTRDDLREAAVSSTVFSRHNGVTNVYLQQRHQGLDVEGAIATVNVGKDGKPLGLSSRFVPNLSASARAQAALRTAPEAALAAARHLGLEPGAMALLEARGGADQATTLSDGGVAERPIEARLVWFPGEKGIRLAWKVEIDTASGDHWFRAFVDAETGEPLGVHDLVVQDSPAAIAAAVARPEAEARAALAPDAPATDGASYRVFPLPFESPTDGGRALVSSPADPSASPFGWHDTNGVAGAEFTVTRGNNAHAYTDVDANNVPDPGSDPDGGPGLGFDFALDLSLNPPT